ncbi:MAG: DUF3784 domain-containing protein [Methanosarcinales archaeon]|jgi:hypothetical protein|nr:DUF3784 domain-containing protein [Methanosarcinales archaeon]
MYISNFLAGGILMLIGLMLRFVKGSEGLIAGFNTMDKSKQSDYNAEKMRICLGNVLIASACILIVGGVLVLLEISPAQIMIISWSLFAVVLALGVIYLNTNSKFKTQRK